MANRRTTSTSYKSLVQLISRAALLAVLPASAAYADEKADRIWHNGPILTMNDAAMRAEAVAEKGGKIVAVGSTADVMKLNGDKTKVIDLGGRTMLTGFFDAHGHMFIGGLQALSANLLAPPDGTVTDIASLQQVIKDWIAANKGGRRKVRAHHGLRIRQRHAGRASSSDARGPR